MVERKYTWADGAKLEEHSHRKHKILREYFSKYLSVRCKLPQQERFRIAIVDGFAGGGRYRCGISGSPLIFIEELRKAVEVVNLQRAVKGLGFVEIECFLIFNDSSRDAIELLKTHVAPLQAEIAQNCPKLHLKIEYLNSIFEDAYPVIRGLLHQGRYKNVIFNLDQCGYSHVDTSTILDIMRSYQSAEVFYTFVIGALLTFLKKNQPEQFKTRLEYLELSDDDVRDLEKVMSNKDWLGAAEKIVFDVFRLCANYVSPFSINNPDGWRYWLIHFANSYRARQVYNEVLHDNATLQAHFGRSGLNMLSYDRRDNEGMLYLFDKDARTSAKDQLLEDVPRFIMEAGDAMPVMNFYEGIYDATPAHADDIHAAIIENPDLEVITPGGGERRKAHTIGTNDIIKVKRQRSFFPMFLNASSKDSGYK